MARPYDRWLQPCQLPDRLPRLLGVDVERGMRNPRRPLDAGLWVKRIEAIRYEREPVRFPEQGDLARGVAGNMHHPEARHLVALLDCPRDLGRATVPRREQLWVEPPRVRGELREVPVVAVGRVR